MPGKEEQLQGPYRAGWSKSRELWRLPEVSDGLDRDLALARTAVDVLLRIYSVAHLGRGIRVP